MVNIDIKLTRRRVLAGILVIGLAAAAAGVGTFALFSDEATSDSNTIDAGELTLDPVEGNFTVNELYPTQSESQSLTTTYTAGVDSDLTVDVSVSDDSDFADQIDIDSAEIRVDDEQEHSFDDVSTLSDLDGTHDVGTVTASSSSVTFDLEFTLGEDTDNSFQGDSTDITVTFNATQQTT